MTRQRCLTQETLFILKQARWFGTDGGEVYQVRTDVHVPEEGIQEHGLPICIAPSADSVAGPWDVIWLPSICTEAAGL